MRTRLKFSGTTTNNYSVDAVYNGSDALDYAESGVYDCIILDIMMPKSDGLSVLKAIREQKNTVPVMLLTAKSEVDDKVAGLDRGADDYITVRMPQAMNARAVFLGDSGVSFGTSNSSSLTFDDNGVCFNK